MKLLLLLILVLPLVFAQRLDVNDFTYVGAFRFPASIPTDTSTWAYGGTGLTYNPNGDPNGPNDNFTGSLFSISHDYQQYVGEISIPLPVISTSKNAAELPIATTIQPFADITEGLMQQANNDNLGDIAYQNGNLYWTVFEYYNLGTNYLSHGVSTTDLSNPHAQGVWRLGSQNDPEFFSSRTSNYLTSIPQTWTDLYAPSMTLASGRHREAGAFGGSKGPALYAYKPETLPYGASLQSKPLLWYNETYTYPEYKACDYWSGAAWIQAGNKSALLIAGRKSFGDEYYGDARPTDCTIDKGYHCDPYESQIILYDTDELGAIANGYEKPYQAQPYAIIRPTEYFWGTCSGELGGAAYDSVHRTLYVIERGVDFTRNDAMPLIHVFKINTNEPTPNSSNQTTTQNAATNVSNSTPIQENPSNSPTYSQTSTPSVIANNEPEVVKQNTTPLVYTEENESKPTSTNTTSASVKPTEDNNLLTIILLAVVVLIIVIIASTYVIYKTLRKK